MSDDGSELPSGTKPRVSDGGTVIAVDCDGGEAEGRKELGKLREQLYVAAQIVALELVDVDEDGQVVNVARTHRHKRFIHLTLLRFESSYLPMSGFKAGRTCISPSPSTTANMHRVLQCAGESSRDMSCDGHRISHTSHASSR